MGRLIDADKFEVFVIRTNGDEEFVNGVQYVLEKIDNAPTVEAIPKDQYEARLKADMVAMLTGIEDKIKHCDINGLWKPNYKEGFNDGVAKCCSIIQHEIDNLKEDQK